MRLGYFRNRISHDIWSKSPKVRLRYRRTIEGVLWIHGPILVTYIVIFDSYLHRWLDVHWGRVNQLLQSSCGSELYEYCTRWLLLLYNKLWKTYQVRRSGWLLLRQQRKLPKRKISNWSHGDWLPSEGEFLARWLAPHSTFALSSHWLVPIFLLWSDWPLKILLFWFDSLWHLKGKLLTCLIFRLIKYNNLLFLHFTVKHRRRFIGNHMVLLQISRTHWTLMRIARRFLQNAGGIAEVAERMVGIWLWSWTIVLKRELRVRQYSYYTFT